jgi:hypothetical protein
MNGVICYLLINRIPKLPTLAIESALQNTDADIYVGYLNRSDLSELPVNPRIHLVDLKSQALKKNLVPKSSDYISFDNNFFFQVVQLKWDLFQVVLSQTDADFLVYLDVDVIVLKDLVVEFANTFLAKKNVRVLAQDFTHNPSVPRLCMGVFAIRNQKSANEFLKVCSELHRKRLETNERFGDDDVITEVYELSQESGSFGLLPQQSFPVGNLINLFLPFGALRGLRPDEPFIYHANFVVGNQKKRLLLYLMNFLTNGEGFFEVVREYLAFSIRTLLNAFARILVRLRGFFK